MIANAAVVLPQPDSPTSPYDSPCSIVSVSAAQHRPVDAAHAVDDLEVLELDRGCGRLAHRSKVCAIASAIRLMPTISVAIASAGKSTAHQTPALMNW